MRVRKHATQKAQELPETENVHKTLLQQSDRQKSLLWIGKRQLDCLDGKGATYIAWKRLSDLLNYPYSEPQDFSLVNHHPCWDGL